MDPGGEKDRDKDKKEEIERVFVDKRERENGI